MSEQEQTICILNNTIKLAESCKNIEYIVKNLGIEFFDEAISECEDCKSILLSGEYDEEERKYLFELLDEIIMKRGTILKACDEYKISEMIGNNTD